MDRVRQGLATIVDTTFNYWSDRLDAAIVLSSLLSFGFFMTVVAAERWSFDIFDRLAPGDGRLASRSGISLYRAFGFCFAGTLDARAESRRRSGRSSFRWLRSERETPHAGVRLLRDVDKLRPRACDLQYGLELAFRRPLEFGERN